MNIRSRAGTEQDYQELGEAFERQNQRKRMSDYDEDQQYKGPKQVFNGSTKIITWLMALMNVLVAAGIVGGIMMYGRMGALEQGFTDMKEKVNMIIEGRIRIPQ